MINNEIIIRKTELITAIATLKAMRMGTIYRAVDPDDFLMNTSISETSDAVAQMFRKLQATEDVFQRLLENTIQALETAEIAFEDADTSAGGFFDDLPYAIIL